MNQRKIFLKILLGLFLTALAGWWVLKSISPGEIAELFRQASLSWLLLGFGFYLIAFAARVGRFSVLFPYEELSGGKLAVITGMHNLAVRLLPNPSGEAVFFYFAGRHGAHTGSILAVLLAYRLLDFSAVALYLSAAAFVLLGYNWLGKQVVFLAAAILFACLPFIIARFPVYRRIEKVEMTGGWVRRKAADLFEAMGVLFAKKGRYRKAILFSLLVWICMSAAYYMFFRAFGLESNFFAVLFAGMVQVFVNVLPSIAGVGVMEAGWVLGFGILGLPKEEILAGAIGVDAMTLLGTFVIGAVSFLWIIITRERKAIS